MDANEPCGGLAIKCISPRPASDLGPHLITHVQTSRAGNGDVDVTPVIHQALQEKGLLPSEHLTDTNSAEAKQFTESRLQYGIDLIAPTRADNKWQAKEQQGFDAASFRIDWEAQQASCPADHQSVSWTPAIDQRDNRVIKIKFSMKDCKKCALKQSCTKSQRRTISLRTKDHHEALLAVRARQKDAAFWEKYRSRAGIEGTLSGASAGLRHAQEPLSWLTENPFPESALRHRYQLSAYSGMVRRTIPRQNSYLSFCCSRGLGVRQQDQVAAEPKADSKADDTQHISVRVSNTRYY